MRTGGNLIGERIDSWRILAPLGRGGAGDIYLARGVGGREAALKLARGNAASLRRELRLLAEIRRPDIVRVLDHGVTDGRVWLVTELLRGDTLATTRRPSHRPTTQTDETLADLTHARGPAPDRGGPSMEVAAACALVERICAPLAWLHGEGLVHGDIKPSNVLVVGEEVVLIDFGLAARTGYRTSIEDAPWIGGSAAWMAPERVLGEPWDARADLYALGCVLYELLTGRSPFAADTLEQTLQAHLDRIPPPPSSLAADVPRSLDALLSSLLSRSPSDRPDAIHLASALAEACGVPARQMRPAPRPWVPTPACRGRGRELAEILAGLEQGPVSVSGALGVGKSRLLLETGRRARATGWRVLAAAARRGDEAPFATVRRALTDVDLTDGDAVSVLASLWPDWVRRAELLGVEPAAVPPPAGAQRRFLEALNTALAELAGTAPVLMLIDDLHHADETTRAWAAGQHPKGVHLLCAGQPLGRDITLGRLDDGAALDVICELLRGASDASRHQVLALAGGNPWLLCELARQVAGGREPTDSRALHDVIAQALAGLDPTAERIARVVAVVGPLPETEWLWRLSGVSERRSAPAIQELIRRGLLEGEPLDFPNDALRAEVAKRVSTRTRRSLHRRVAAWLAAGKADSSGPHTPRLARHLEACGQQREAAMQHWASALNLQKVGHNDAALEHYTRAIALLPMSDSHPIRVAMAFELLAHRGEIERAVILLEGCVREAREAQSDAQLVDAGLRLGSLVWRAGQHDRAQALLGEVLRAAERSGYLVHAGMIRGELASIAHEEGDYAQEQAQNEAAIEAFDRAAAEPEPRRVHLRPFAVPVAQVAAANAAIFGANLGLTYLSRGRGEQAVELLERCIATLESLPEFRFKAITPRGILAMAHMRAGRLAQAEPLFRRVLADARALGDRLNECITHQMLARLALEKGMDPGTEVSLGLALALRYGFAHPAVTLQKLEAEGQIGRGQLSEAVRTATAARAAAEAIGLRAEVVGTGVVLARALRLTGRTDLARDVLARASADVDPDDPGGVAAIRAEQELLQHGADLHQS